MTVVLAVGVLQAHAVALENDYVREAKTEATGKKRLEIAIGWISEGKPRNWKYMR